MPPKKKPADAAPAKPAKAKGAKTVADPVKVDAIRHGNDKRPNIPTRELGSLVAADEAGPTTVLYARDSSLDPQLVWKGKDAQDAAPLEVPAVPIYIQEKIHAQHLIEDLRKRAAVGRPKSADLFADFNGLDDDAQRTDFYHHGQHWTNRLILGDSLLVMTSLAEKERLKGRVQCIYIDPPYGIKFGSNWQVSTRKRDVKDAKAEDLTREPEQVKAFRDTWEMGINSYLSYLRDRLTVALGLLTESGSIFVQIGDENVHLVRALLDEVFGSENFCGQITFVKTTGQSSPSATTKVLTKVADYVLWYAKQLSSVKYHELFAPKGAGDEDSGNYRYVEVAGLRRGMTREEMEQPSSLPTGSRIFRYGDLTSAQTYTGGSDPFEFEGTTYRPTTGRGWSTKPEGLRRLASAKRLHGIGRSLVYVRYLDDFPVTKINNVWLDTVISGFGTGKVYVVETLPLVIQRCLLMTTDPGDLVLDPTCGSGTTAYIAEQWGRRWITIDTSRVAVTLARTRLMAARFPYYLLADSPEGRKKETELAGIAIAAPDNPTGKPDIRKGFVYRRVPHVTLKSIANNPEIKEGMTREQIDAAIKKHADTEVLHDQPYEDKGTLRVCGPFTVESLSPHRMLPTGDDESAAPADASPATDYATVILANLRKSPVQNTKKGERLKFDRLDPYPGRALIAEGDYTDADGKARRVGVCLGPEFGTVGPELIMEAAKEAARCVKFDFDLVLVCGFAFDPHVWEEGKEVERQVGKMKVLLVRMNPDLAMGDELLKKTGAGNLFMVFGEPDVELRKRTDGKYEIEVKGVDVFDPQTGEIRSSGPEDIACWFVDTAYDGRSFFVRQAYFLGANDPYEKLKRALRAEVDEAAWAQLYTTTSVPFDRPANGKVAVKVINHYGDEVLKVYDVAK